MPYAVSIGLMVLLFSAADSDDPPGIVINEDDSHFYGTRTAADMTIEGLNAFVDQYANTGVSHLFLCPNAMRTSYKSAVRDAIWEYGNQKVPEGNTARWPENARLLYERGLDPYAVWIARCREKGLSPWLSMRMNDVHNVSDKTDFLLSTFWLAHPEYRRVPENTTGWVEQAFNYGIPEVREYNMKLVRELLERYDADGLELDWMRFGYHFKPGEEAQGAQLLTEFMRQVRALADEQASKRGHAVEISARVPATPEAARGLGMDGVAWVKEGLVDMLVPTPFWTTSDFDIPVEAWREQLGEDAGDIVLAPGLEFNMRAYPGADAVANDLESTRGFAASAWQRGADQIYLFNFMDSETIPVSNSDYRILIENGLSMDVAMSSPRRHVICFHDTVPAGVSNGAQLPASTDANPAFRIHIGPAPQQGSATFIIGLAAGEGVETARLDAAVNGTPCASMADSGAPSKYPGAVRAMGFQCPLPALLDGYNEFCITQAVAQPAQKIVWAEVRIVPPEK